MVISQLGLFTHFLQNTPQTIKTGSNVQAGSNHPQPYAHSCSEDRHFKHRLIQWNTLASGQDFSNMSVYFSILGHWCLRPIQTLGVYPRPSSNAYRHFYSRYKIVYLIQTLCWDYSNLDLFIHPFILTDSSSQILKGLHSSLAIIILVFLTLRNMFIF